MVPDVGFVAELRDPIWRIALKSLFCGKFNLWRIDNFRKSSDLSSQKQGARYGAPGKMGILTWEELLDLWKNSSGANLELRLPCATGRQLVLSQPLGAS
jgi:hypothetical protein